MSCEKKSKPAPAVEPWVPVAGLPLSGHNAPEPELTLEHADWVPPFEEITRKRLIEIAYQFHPRIEPSHDQTPGEFDYLYDNSPERIAMRNTQHHAWERIGTWRGLVDAVSTHMPEGAVISDRTIPGHDAAYFAVLSLPKSEGGTRLVTVAVHMSFLVPFYIVYEKNSVQIKYPTIKRWKTERVTTDISSELKPLVDTIEYEIKQRYGFRRLDDSLLSIELPRLFIDGASTSAPTLKDALFSAHTPIP